LPSSSPTTLQRARTLLAGKQTAVLGLAREGLDLSRFLTDAGAHVVVGDRRSRDQLDAEVAALGGRNVRFLLGTDVAPELLDVDLLFASPGVPPQHPLLRQARARGVTVTSLVQLFFELCPAPILGITGSAGKTTTTALVGEMFRAAGRDVFVGGNIGHPLLGELGRIQPESWVVMELSSFQLEAMQRSPHVAAITNVTPNHLDRHPTMEDYWAAKGQILAHQSAGDWAILNADDAWSSRYAPRANVLHFSLEQPVDGAYLEQDTLVLMDSPLVRTAEVKLRGRHNLANVLAASVSCHAAGIERDAMVEAIRAFRGVPHRLQVVAERDGVQFINDSIATAPERSMAALRAFGEPVVLIAGGRDKHLPMAEWADLIRQRVRHVVLFGEMSDLVADALAKTDPPFIAISRAESMEEAVVQAARAAQPGDVVLLSPGGTSYDLYKDFEERGTHFARVVEAL
jgi:UDP-N-acetylmuramoylalanine--D-glutamate ligase